jgi:hypothetical protein
MTQSYEINQNKADSLLVTGTMNQPPTWGCSWQPPASCMPAITWCVIPDDDALVLPVDDHVSVHIVCKSIDVWRVFILCLGMPKKKKIMEQHSWFLFFALEMNLPLYISVPILTSWRLHGRLDKNFLGYDGLHPERITVECGGTLHRCVWFSLQMWPVSSDIQAPHPSQRMPLQWHSTSRCFWRHLDISSKRDLPKPW